MKPFILAAIAAIILTLLVACTNPNPTTPEHENYNNIVIAFWTLIATSVLGPAINALVTWVTNRNVKELAQKVDVQQEELLKKTDRQTDVIVQNTTAAVEEVGQKAADAVLVVAQQAADDGRRDRRSTDKPMLGG